MGGQNQVIEARVQKADNRAIGRFPWATHQNFSDVSDTSSVTEAIEKSRLNFTVKTEPLFLSDGRRVPTKAIVREDTNQVLSSNAGEDWTPVQNIVKFNWFNRYLDNKQAKLLSAGYLGNGEKVCLVARLNYNTNFTVTKGDDIAKYLLLTDSFQTGKSMKIMLLAARLVCGNGAVQMAGETYRKIPHRKAIEINMEGLHSDITSWDNGFNDAMESAKFLSSKSVKSQGVLFDYFAKVMDFEQKLDEETGQKEYPTRSLNTMERLNELFEDNTYNGPQRSWWNAYNSVTAYFNHFAGRNQDTSLDSLWFGANATRQTKAMKFALEYSMAV